MMLGQQAHWRINQEGMGGMPDLRVYAREAARRAGCDPDLFERQIQQESGFDPAAFNAGSGATGVAQIVPRFHPGVDPHDPLASLDYAAEWMARLHRQYGTYRKALAAYNWGPGNVAGWDGQRASLPMETRSYLDVILGDGWPEPPGTASVAGPDADSGTLGGAAAGGAGTTLYVRVQGAGIDRLNLRAEPGTRARVVERLSDGTVLEVLGGARVADDLTWIPVRTRSGSEGWVATRYLEIVAVGSAGEVVSPMGRPATPAAPEPTAPVQYRVATDRARFRVRPGTDAPVLSELPGGTLVEDDGGQPVSASGHLWRKVRLEGRVGWIAAELLNVVAEPSPPDPVPAGQLHFDPTTPTELQVQSWTCSIRSVMWMLKSLGIPVTPEEAQNRMYPKYVSAELGLLDASGAGMVEALRTGWGLTATSHSPVTFDEVATWAGRRPVAIGGRIWGHWTAVRGANEAGDLVLANPGGTGPRYGQQTLNRQQFQELGWFSAVTIPLE